MADKKRRELERKIEALVIAIPREEEARDYYRQLAEEYEDEASKEMFRFLADQEENHRVALEKILSNLEKELAGLS